MKIKLLSLLLVASLGCSKTSQPETATAPAAPAPAAQSAATESAPSVELTAGAPVDVKTGPHTETILYVMKDKKPLVMMDMAPELARINQLSPSGQGEYLLKRGLVTVITKALARPEYKSQSSFVVRMIVLVGRDEYQRPQWGSARELALLEVDRSALADLSSDQVAELDGAGVNKLVRSKKFSLANLSGIAAK